MTTAPSTAPNAAASSAKPRSSGERVVVWGVILILVAIAGYEFYVKRSFEAAEKAVLDRLASTEGDTKGATHLTDRDMPEVLGGKKPAFQGKPGQVYMLNSNYYEAYVWKSLLKNQFVPPPKEPEMLNMYAIYSGEVRPEKVKYRTPGFDKNIDGKPGLFSAYVMYVYYGAADKNGVREVINVTSERVPYHDAQRTPPDAEELKKRHEQNLASAIANIEKMGKKLTDKEKEELDSWKHPTAESDANMRNIPNWDPVTQTLGPAKHDPEPAVIEPQKSAQPTKPAPSKGDAEKPAAKKPETPAEDKKVEKKPESPVPEKKVDSTKIEKKAESSKKDL